MVIVFGGTNTFRVMAPSGLIQNFWITGAIEAKFDKFFFSRFLIWHRNKSCPKSSADFKNGITLEKFPETAEQD